MKRFLFALIFSLIALPAIANVVTLPNLGAGSAISDSDLFLTRQGANTQDKKVTGTQLKNYINTLPLSGFAATTSAGLRGVLSDETGTGFAYFQGGDLGTPSAGILTNATGLPISTGLTGAGTGILAFLATPTSANLRAALTDETGTGNAVFSISPALTGAPTAPTQTPGDTSTDIATDAFVAAAVTAGTAPSAVNAGTVYGNNGLVSGTPTFSSFIVLGVPGNHSGPQQGSLGIANQGTNGDIITINNLHNTAAYNFNMPATAGTGGWLLTSAGGGASDMTWTNPATITAGDTTKINGVALGTTTATAGNMLLGSGSQWASVAMSGDCTITSAGAVNCTTQDGAIPATKGAVRAASTTAYTATYLSNTLTNAGSLAAFSTDGVSPSVGDRILIKNQASTLQNGCYNVTTVGSGAVAWVLTRCSDYDTSAEIKEGDTFFVEEGTTLAETGWVQTTSGTITVGTTAIVFAQSVSASQTVTLTGNVTGTGQTGTNISTTIAASAVTNSMLAGSIDLTAKVTGTLPTANGGTGFASEVVANAIVSPNVQTGTSYTLVLADGLGASGTGGGITLNNASAITETVPPNSSVAFPIGTQIVSCQLGAGQVTMAAGAGVTLHQSAATLKFRAQYSCVTLWKYLTDTWLVFGDLAAS